MRAVVQRVRRAGVTVENETVGAVGQGFLVLVGVMDSDTEREAELLAQKTAALRVFADGNGKMNLSVLDVDGEVLAVSQFTLCADLKKGNRPSFTPSAPPERAERLYRRYCETLRKAGVRKVETGVFGAHMQVELVNDGPVTIVYDTELWKRQEK